MYNATYDRNHKRVRKERGRARDHTCVDCGKPALDWSQVKGTDGSDPIADYEPRCRKCHVKYDGMSERLIGNKWGEFNAGMTRDEEARRMKRNWANQYAQGIDPDALDEEDEE